MTGSVVVLIPAYKPDAKMLPLCRALRGKGLDVLLVDDGGGAQYRPLFDEAEALDGVSVFHAGTSHNADGELVTAGGRVLNVVALGKTFEQARERAYAACDLISFEGKQFRTDIGAKAARGRSAWE